MRVYKTHLPALAAILIGFAAVSGCDVGVFQRPGDGNSVDGTSGNPLPDTEAPDGTLPGDGGTGDVEGPGEQPVWRKAFDATSVGALSGVWGSGPDDVFMVGGTPAGGEIYHFDGSEWRAMTVPEVPLLVWAFGFSSSNVLAVGVGGGIVRYDGTDWRVLPSGTTEDLWGVWGRAPDDVWIVGGTVGQGDPVLLHYDGSTIVAYEVPQNDRNASALFKVWGIGSKTFAVGERGLILENDAGAWFQVPAGPRADEDFVSLWGTSDDHIVAVGGRSGARIARYDGTAWTTMAPLGVPGLNAVYMTGPDEAVVGGVDGFVGSFDPTSGVLTPDPPISDLPVHAAWGDGAGAVYAVGGRFATPYAGFAAVRAIGGLAVDPVPPRDLPPECVVDTDCAPGRVCSEGACVPAPGCAGPDTDGDGWLDDCDDCVLVPDPEQRDSDGDGRGDACDACPGFDDAIDADADGVPDACDVCAGSNDALDDDQDGVPDGCDVCHGFADAIDTDGDGVFDGCDRCPGFDDKVDADGDGVADGCDACPGYSDASDSDGDGVPNGCDHCPGADDRIDSDSDGVADGCDACAGFDDALDADGDTVPDDCDACPGHDDRDDADGDSVPDGCDTCPQHDDLVDSDADGVADGCDLCAGFSDTEDTDGDGVPDGCDLCDGEDDSLDADHDGVPDGCDVCPGFDDSEDTDGDGVPNGCDVCDGDDIEDADADGVPDACDICAGFDDGVDSDLDGAPDGCDLCPGSDDTLDADADGVPDACDICPGGDDRVDTDADGVPDGCDPCPADSPDDSDGDGVCDSVDRCPGFDDSIDDDLDTVPNACDRCNGFDDRNDLDRDSIPDACDVCAGFDDLVDDDADGVPNGCDLCPSFDDALDADHDGVPDGCDRCAGSDDRQDTDGDGVPDGCDVCAGADDSIDTDADGVPDGCDACPGSDDLLDNDGDGTPDGCDVCPGHDDSVDSDGNGIPDGCCAAETDCALGEQCDAGVCQPVSVDVQVGYGNPFVALSEGGDLPLLRGFQGYTELYLSYRTKGFTPSGLGYVKVELVATDTNDRLILSYNYRTFYSIAPDINEYLLDLRISTEDQQSGSKRSVRSACATDRDDHRCDGTEHRRHGPTQRHACRRQVACVTIACSVAPCGRRPYACDIDVGDKPRRYI